MGTLPLPVMSSNVLPSPFVASASQEFSASWAAWKAFNGSAGTTVANESWSDNGGATPQWLRIDLGSGVAFKPTKYVIRAYNAAQGPNSWNMRGSNNGSSWTTLDTRAAITVWTGRNTYGIVTPQAFRYFEIEITTKNSAYAAIDEFYLVGEEEVPVRANTLTLIPPTIGFTASAPVALLAGTLLPSSIQQIVDAPVRAATLTLLPPAEVITTTISFGFHIRVAVLTQTDIANSVLDALVDGNKTVAEYLKIIAASVAGKLSIVPSGLDKEVSFRNLNDTQDAIVGIYTDEGARTSVAFNTGD